jgi:hypothetical protein
MRRLAKWLIRLYPVRWRNRYGSELEALVEDCDWGLAGRFDVLKGALLVHSVRWPVVVGGCALLGALAGLGVPFLLPQKCHLDGRGWDLRCVYDSHKGS